MSKAIILPYQGEYAPVAATKAEALKKTSKVA